VPEEPEQPVSPVELFFDLVFVFALTQVTTFLTEDMSVAQLGRGVMILAAIWWSWVGFSWLTNRAATDVGPIRLFVLVAMVGMLAVALAVPHAFGDDAVLFGAAYLVVRLVQLAGLWLLADRIPAVRAAQRRLIVTSSVGPLLILAAAFADGAAQAALWALALVVDYGGATLATRREGEWNVHAGHFAERHGLIVIIALGESIAEIGIGAEGGALTGAVLLAAAFGVVACGALWWSYFDVTARAAARRLARSVGAERGELARDAFSYLHLPMVTGILLFALALRLTLERPGEPLEAVPAFCLFAGPAVYYLGHVLFRLRMIGSVSRPRLYAIAALALAAALATGLDALAALALACGIIVAVVAYEAVADAETRARLRAA
jgi:low temperature requirement protein LtrA